MGIPKCFASEVGESFCFGQLAEERLEFMPVSSNDRVGDRANGLVVKDDVRFELFKEKIMSLVHTEIVVGGLGSLIVLFDVESKATHIGPVFGEPSNVLVHAAIDPLPSKFLFDVDALDPPKVAISPVAPFFRHHQAGNHLFFNFADQVKTLGWIDE